MIQLTGNSIMQCSTSIEKFHYILMRNCFWVNFISLSQIQFRHTYELNRWLNAGNSDWKWNAIKAITFVFSYREIYLSKLCYHRIVFVYFWILKNNATQSIIYCDCSLTMLHENNEKSRQVIRHSLIAKNLLSFNVDANLIRSIGEQ